MSASTLRVRKHRAKLKAARAALVANTNNALPIGETLEYVSAAVDLELSQADEEIALAAARNSWPRRAGQKN